MKGDIIMKLIVITRSTWHCWHYHWFKGRGHPAKPYKSCGLDSSRTTEGIWTKIYLNISYKGAKNYSGIQDHRFKSQGHIHEGIQTVCGEQASR